MDAVKKMLEIYHLFIREIERENGQGEGERERKIEGGCRKKDA